VLFLCLKEAILSKFPNALTSAELSGTGGVRPCFTYAAQQRSLWHSLTEDEQRTVLFQFQRLSGIQFNVSFDEATHEIELGTDIIAVLAR
jgi:hypothetical protein